MIRRSDDIPVVLMGEEVTTQCSLNLTKRNIMVLNYVDGSVFDILYISIHVHCISIQDAEAIERELFNYAGHDSYRHRQ